MLRTTITTTKLSGEVTQQLKCLPCKCEAGVPVARICTDVGWMWQSACSSSILKVTTVNPHSKVAGETNSIFELRDQLRDSTSINKMESDQRMLLLSVSGLSSVYTCTHTLTHTFMYL